MMRVQFSAPMTKRDSECLAQLRERWNQAGLSVATTTEPTTLSITAVRPGEGYRRFLRDFTQHSED